VDPPPATAWLEEAAVRDGMPAAITLINALSDGVPQHSALELAFRPETTAAVTALPDYFAWVLLVSARHRILNPPRAYGLRGDSSRHQFIMQALASGQGHTISGRTMNWCGSPPPPWAVRSLGSSEPPAAVCSP
jgi:hypothetical protein